jgi:dephospho-CoA kinase
MHTVGLTGSLGTGKTTVAAMFARRGAKVIDADAIIRQLLAKNKKCIKKVAKIFPGAILSSGEVDRARLANVVFQNPRDLQKLTDILYPEALREVRTLISLYRNAKLVVLDVPLLFESGWEKLADTTIVVKSTRAQQLERAQARLGIPQAQVLKRLKFQMPLKDKCRLADIIIDNSGTLQETRTQVDAIINRLLQRTAVKTKTRS